MSKNIYFQLISFTLLCICTTLFSQEKLEVDGAIIIKNSEATSPTPGTVRWTGTDFEGWNGLIWVSLTGNATLGAVTDIDGNSYKTIRIGNQEWMVENLRVMKYNDNMAIDHITNNASWQGLSMGAWCWYNNETSHEVPYGKLYNWYAVNTGKLCPSGWHIPSDDEWTILTDRLGGLSAAGGKMKESGLVHWNTPNKGASNETGFTGLPGGNRNTDGNFYNLGNSAFWWASSESSTTLSWYRGLYYLYSIAYRFNLDKRLGFSVRCVKG